MLPVKLRAGEYLGLYSQENVHDEELRNVHASIHQGITKHGVIAGLVGSMWPQYVYNGFQFSSLGKSSPMFCQSREEAGRRRRKKSGRILRPILVRSSVVRVDNQ